MFIMINISGGISVMRQSKGGLITGQSLAWAAPAYHLRPRGWVEFAQNLIVWESDRSWESDHLWESDLNEIISDLVEFAQNLIVPGNLILGKPVI